MAVGPRVSALFQLLRSTSERAETNVGASLLLVPLEPWSFAEGEAPPIERATVPGRGQLLPTTSGKHQPVLGATCLLLMAGGPKLLGRSDTVDLVVDQPTVSRLHAEIVDVAEHFSIRDRGSYNGTLVNNRVLLPEDLQSLSNGDVIILGEAQLLFTSLDHLRTLLGSS